MRFRWPWMSRAVAGAQLLALDERRRSEVALLEREREAVRADLRRERFRSAKLTALILRLKRDGAVLLPERTLTMVRREPSVFERALQQNERARKDPRLHAYLLKRAHDLQRAGELSDEAICERIVGWSTVTHDDDKDEEAFA